MLILFQSAVSQHSEQASHQLKLYLLESADFSSDHVSGGFSYRSDLFPDALIRNIIHLCARRSVQLARDGMLPQYSQVALDPSQPLSELTATINTKLGKISRRGLNASPDPFRAAGQSHVPDADSEGDE